MRHRSSSTAWPTNLVARRFNQVLARPADRGQVPSWAAGAGRGTGVYFTWSGYDDPASSPAM